MTGTPEHFDAIVIGSGFGGSVSAYRLAEAGLRVCLLERGKAYPPGSFARTPAQMRTNFWDPTEGPLRTVRPVVVPRAERARVERSRRRLADLRQRAAAQGREVVRPRGPRRRRRRALAGDAAPTSTRTTTGSRRCSGPSCTRSSTSPTPRRPRRASSKRAAQALGLDWFRPPLAVTFAGDGGDPVPGEPIAEPHPNLHGRTRHTCRLCGECDIGCNYGSKNTLDYNYLTAAQRLGAEIRTRCEVRKFAPEPGGGYRVDYVALRRGRRARGPADRHLRPGHVPPRAGRRPRDPGRRARSARYACCCATAPRSR